MKGSLERKLLKLTTGEFAATAVFALLWVYYLSINDKGSMTALSNVFAFILLELILLQGSFYWYLKWKKVKKGRPYTLPNRQLTVFLWFKRLNIVLLLVGILLLIFDQAFSFFFLLVYGFALIEHINYYHIRLSYMNTEEVKEFIRQKGFRRSVLAKELESIRKRRYNHK
ncbi:hypothetical protein EQV77_17600 [Halobacillus fulvus]|nr:hypothetical protein EQV77_17600 [Halobacillus fulvus]